MKLLDLTNEKLTKKEIVLIFFMFGGCLFTLPVAIFIIGIVTNKSIGSILLQYLIIGLFILIGTGIYAKKNIKEIMKKTSK